MRRREFIALLSSDRITTFSTAAQNVCFWDKADIPITPSDVRFSNRPVGVKRFQTIHDSGDRGRSQARASLRNRHIGPSIMGSEDEVEQSLGRPCRRQVQADMRTHLIHRPARDTFHRWVELGFPPTSFGFANCSRGCSVSGPAELGAVNPDAVHDHSQSTGQRDNRSFHAAALGDRHRPGLEP